MILLSSSYQRKERQFVHVKWGVSKNIMSEKLMYQPCITYHYFFFFLVRPQPILLLLGYCTFK